MNFFRLEEMKGGWFVGDFEPTALKTGAVEVGVKSYRRGERNALHHHKIAIEVTLVIDGRVIMAGREMGAGDIAVVLPGEASDFLALDDARVVVAKIPSARNDKYEGECGA